LVKRNAAADEGEGPERLCVVTRAVRPPEELIRFVAAPDGTVTPDLHRKLPGRGVWVTASRKAVTEAVRRKAFGRALKSAAVAPPDLPAMVEGLHVRAAREALSLANKAGLVVSGFSKVEAAAERGRLAAVVHASDAAPDGVRKIGQALRRRRADGGGEVPVLGTLDSSQLDLALGRSHVIHAALLDGPASRAALARFRALERYRDETAVGVSPDTPDADDPSDETAPRETAGYERNE
jgi:hypothetical protein